MTPDNIEMVLDPEQEGQDYTSAGNAPEQGDDIVTLCKNLYDEFSASPYRKRKLEERDTNRKAYRGERDDLPKDEDWRSNRSLMIAATVIDNLEPRIMAQLFGDSELVDVKPVGPEDVPGTKKTADFLKWALRDNIQIEDQLKPALHDMFLDGTSIIIPLWHQEERQTMIREPVPTFESAEGPVQIAKEQLQAPGIQQLIQMGALRFAGMESRITMKPVTEWKVKVDQVPLNDAFFPDTGDDWEAMPFLRMIYPLYHELEELSEDNGGPYKNISRRLVYGNRRDDNTDAQDTDAIEKDARHSEYSEECPLLECHVLHKGEWFLISFSIHAGWTEVRRQPMGEVFAHGRKAPKRLAMYRETNESMGTGIPKKIEHFATGADDIYNEMIDNCRIENMPFFTYERAPGTFGMDLTLRAGKGIAFPPGANPQFPRFSTNSQKFIQFIELLLQMLERLVSLMAFTQTGQVNQGSAGSETYAGMNLLAHEANIKHQYTGRGLRRRLEELIRDILSIYGQYIPYDAMMRIFQDDQYTFQPFDLQAIQGQYDLELRISSSSGNAMLNRQEKRELAEMFKGDPIIDQKRLHADILEAYDIRDGESYIKPEINQLIAAFIQDPGVMQAVQQYMQQAQRSAMEQDATQEAQKNIMRQSAQRQAELPFENQKIVDQAKEAAKRQIAKPVVEQAMAQEAMNGTL